MKKIYIICIAVMSALIFSPQDAYARKFKHEKEVDAQYFPRSEIYIQYGTPTILELVTMLKAPVAFKGFDTKNQIFTGTPGIGYNFSVKENLSIGIFAGYSYAQADGCQMDGNSIGSKIYTEKVRNYVGQLSANWQYYQEGALTLESGLYLGLAYMDRQVDPLWALSGSYPMEEEIKNSIPKSGQQVKFAYHFTACKIRYGNTFGVFGELGFGFRGLVNVGLSVKL